MLTEAVARRCGGSRAWATWDEEYPQYALFMAIKRVVVVVGGGGFVFDF